MREYFISLTIFFVLLAGCSDDNKYYDECLEIETARCEFRHRCDSGFDIDQCIYYYEEQCLVRKIKADYKPKQFKACVDAIDALGSSDECSQLEDPGSGSEICEFDSLEACRLFLCQSGGEDTEDRDSSSEVGSDDKQDTETDIPQGLNPG